MKDVPLGEVIAERRYTFRRLDGSTTEVRLQIGKPRPWTDAGDFVCAWQLAGLDREERFYQGGIDQVQALTLVLRVLPVWLRVTAKAHGGELLWFDEPDLGLPEFSVAP